MSQHVRLNDSQFNKWRTLVALAHVDGLVCDVEKGFIIDRLQNRRVDPEQIKLIEQDFDQAHSPGELFEKITDPRDRATLLYLARIMFLSNNDKFCDYEKLYYDKFKAKHMSSIDMAQLIEQVKKVETEVSLAEDLEPKRGSFIFRSFSNLLDKFF